MKSIVFIGGLACWGPASANPFSIRAELAVVGPQRVDCFIAQCQGVTVAEIEDVNMCLSAASDGCLYGIRVILDGDLSADEMCVALEPNKNDPEDFVLAPTLDLTAATKWREVPLVEGDAWSYVSGSGFWQTANVNAGAEAEMRFHKSDPTKCEAESINPNGQAMAQWAAGDDKLVLDSTRFLVAGTSDDPWTKEIGNVKFVDRKALFTQKAAGDITGFYANNYTVQGRVQSTRTPPPFGINLAFSNIQSSCGCQETEVAAALTCLKASAPGCEFTGSYTFTDSVFPARQTCIEGNTMNIPLEYIIEDLTVSNIAGDLEFSVGGDPAESCEISVSTSNEALNPTANGCGLTGELTEFHKAEVSPEKRTFTLSDPPRDTRTFVVAFNKAFTQCGGGIRTIAATQLTSEFQYTRPADPVPEVTTTTTTTTTTGPLDPFEDPRSDGVSSVLSLAAAGFLAFCAIQL